MIIKISNLSDGVHNFNFNESIKEIELEEPFTGKFLSDIKLQKSRNQITLDAEITLNANFECDRCNAMFNTDIVNNFQLVYLFGEEPVESSGTSISYLPAVADKINLAFDLRDYALLAIPMKKLCKKDCKGLCIQCGRDLNERDCGCAKEDIDLRWLPLLELKNKLNTN